MHLIRLGLVLFFASQLNAQSSQIPSSGGGGSVAVSNFPATQPISGTVGITGTGNALAINGNGEITVQAQGTVRINSNYTAHFVPASAAGDIFGAQDNNEYAQINFNLRGTYAASVQIHLSTDNGVFYPTMIYPEDGSAPSLTVSAPGNYVAKLNGRYWKPVMTSYTSGTLLFSDFVTAIPRAADAPLWLASGAKQDTANTSLSNIDGKLPSLMSSAPGSDTGQSAIPVRIISQLGAGSGGGGLTNTELRASAVPVSGSFFQATQPVSIASSVAVTGPLTDTQLRASAVPISASSLPLPSGAATSALQTTGNSSLSNMDTKTPALGQALAAGSVPVVLTAAQLSTLTPLSSVSVSNFPATQAVSGTFFQATQPVSIAATVAVSGPLTDTQLRASAVPISAAALPLPSGASTESTLAAMSAKLPTSLGTKTIANSMAVNLASDQTLTVVANVGTGTQPVSGTVTANAGTGTFAVSGPLTDTQLRASVVPVSLTSTTISNFPASQAVTGPLTDTQIRATALPVSGTITANAGTGTFAVSGPLTDTQLRATAVPVSGTVSANATLAAETTKVIGTVNISAAQSVTSNDGGTKTTAATMPSGGVGATGWLSAIYDRLAGSTNTETNAIFTKLASPTKDTYLYGSGTAAYTPVATATDMIQIRGSATKTIRVIDFVVCPSATAAGAQTMYLVKRSTANTGGTSAAITAGAMDSTDAAVSGSVVTYSVNASPLGTAVWTRPRRVMFQITAGTTVIEPCTNLLLFQQDNFAAEPVVLRGAAESLSLNNNGAALAAGYRIDSWYAIVTEE